MAVPVHHAVEERRDAGPIAASHISSGPCGAGWPWTPHTAARSAKKRSAGRGGEEARRLVISNMAVSP